MLERGKSIVLNKGQGPWSPEELKIMYPFGVIWKKKVYNTFGKAFHLGSVGSQVAQDA